MFVWVLLAGLLLPVLAVAVVLHARRRGTPSADAVGVQAALATLLVGLAWLARDGGLIPLLVLLAALVTGGSAVAGVLGLRRAGPR